MRSGYRTQSADTSTEAERLLIERYRSMSAADKIRLVRELCRSSQELALAGARKRHPEADEAELRMRVASMRLPAWAMKVLFG